MAESQWYLEVNGQKIGPFALDHIQGLYADGEIKGYHQVTSDQLEGQWITVQELVDSLRVAVPPPPASDFSAPPPPPADAEEDHTTIALPVLESADENSGPSFSPTLVEAGSSAESAAPPPPPEAAAVFNSDFQPPPRPSVLTTSAAAASVTTPSASAATIKTLPPEVKEDPVAPINDPAISMLSSLQLFKERQEKTTDTHDRTLVIQSDMLGRGDRTSSPSMWMFAVLAGIILGCISWGVLKTLKNKTKAPPGTMTQISNHETPPVPQPVMRAAPPVTSNVTPPATSAFRPAEGPHETQHRLAPPRPLVAPVSQPAPVRQFESPRDQQPPQIDTAQPNEVPPQPQYAPQYQAYPPPAAAGNGDPNNPQVPQQPYVDPNNPTAPPVYPTNGENFQNANPGGQPPPQIAPPQGAVPPQNPPGADSFNGNPPVPQQDQDQLLQQQQQQNQAPAQPVYPSQ